MRPKKDVLTEEELLSLRKMIHVRGGSEDADSDWQNIVWKKVENLTKEKRSFKTKIPVSGGVRG